MVYLAIATVILWVLALITGGISIYHQRKKSIKKSKKFLMYSIILFAEFIVAFALSVYLKDPIPYFNLFIVIALFTAGYYLPTALPHLIASEVKKELEPERKVEYRKLSVGKAREEIVEYLEHRKEETWIENIIDDLSIEPEIVIKVIKELHKRGEIKEAR